jgi:RNA polymerase primary sigma factor
LALAQEARHLDEVIATDSEKARKAGLGTSARILSKAQLALIAPPPAPVAAPAKSEGKAGKAAVVLDDEGNEIVVEEDRT